MVARLAEITLDPAHVRLDPARLMEVAARAPASMATRWHEAFRSADEHYRWDGTSELSDRDLLQYVIVSASQNWLIWQRESDGTVIPLTLQAEGTTYVGAWALFACHLRALHQGRNILDPAVLETLTLSDIEEHYRDERGGHVRVQLLDDRLANFREIGRVLRERFDGHFLNVLKHADGHLYRDDGQGLVQILVREFPRSFGDWPMAKLPNVIVLDLLDRRTSRRFPPEIDRLLDFKDLEHLEGGADYYRPLFFLRVGVLAISEEFKQKLRQREAIVAGSRMEQEFRAFTLAALRELAAHSGGWPSALPGLEVETHAQAFLRCRRCRVGISDEELPCSYRPVCKATHDDHELMECLWPLVITTEY